MKLSDEFIETLKSHIANDLVSATRHSELPLTVLTYSKETQYSRNWDEVTTRCRGMIVDDEYNIVAHNMEKFFNDTELEGLGIEVPKLPYTIFEKMDGSLIHLWNYKGNWHTSSKGAFFSEQAIMAKNILEEKYSYDIFNPDFTYVFELIEPSNRIVVDYGDRRELVLLEVIHDGKELGRNVIQNYNRKYGISIPKIYDAYKIYNLRNNFNHLKGTEHEGFVIRFSNGFRMKIKLDNYLILHRAISNMGPLSFWESVDLDTLKINSFFLEQIPEEFRELSDKIVNSLEPQMLAEWNRIENLAKNCPIFDNNKDRWMYLSANFPLDKNALVTYLYGKHKEVREMIWKKFRPTGNVLKEE